MKNGFGNGSYTKDISSDMDNTDSNTLNLLNATFDLPAEQNRETNVYTKSTAVDTIASNLLSYGTSKNFSTPPHLKTFSGTMSDKRNSIFTSPLLASNRSPMTDLSNKATKITPQRAT